MGRLRDLIRFLDVETVNQQINTGFHCTPRLDRQTSFFFSFDSVNYFFHYDIFSK